MVDQNRKFTTKGSVPRAPLVGKPIIFKKKIIGGHVAVPIKRPTRVFQGPAKSGVERTGTARLVTKRTLGQAAMIAGRQAKRSIKRIPQQRPRPIKPGISRSVTRTPQQRPRPVRRLFGPKPIQKPKRNLKPITGKRRPLRRKQLFNIPLITQKPFTMSMFLGRKRKRPIKRIKRRR